MTKFFIIIGAISGFLSVTLGAFGAHSLQNILLPTQLKIYHTAVEYQMYHSLIIVLIGILSRNLENINYSQLKLSGYFFITGIILFSGSLYLLTLTNVSKLGLITPFGGLAFLVGWFLLALFAYKKL